MIFAAYLLGAIVGFASGYVVRSVRAIRQMDQVQDALDKLVVAWANRDSFSERTH